MLNIDYAISDAEEILKEIASQLGQPIDSGYLGIRNDTVDGTLFGRNLSANLSIYGVSIAIHQKMNVARTGTKNKDLVVLDFHIDSLANLSNNDDGISRLMVGSYLASSSYASSAEYIPGTDAKFISLIMDRSWLQAHIDIREERLGSLLFDKKDFFFFREIGFQLATEVNEAFSSIYSKDELNNSYLLGCIYKILGLFFQDFRLEYDLNAAINTDDLKAIEEVKRFIDRNSERKIEMKELLDIAAMSETKFRKLFRTMVGSSPIDYYLDRKLWYAKSLIESGELISSVVLRIGYSNHSYFTRSFKSRFGLTPQKYQEEVMKRSKD